MRLINIRTLELEEYFGDKIPRYAILSHTWGEEEVSYQDWQNVNQRSAKKGYQKIRACCDVARGFPIDHLWVDTNCINKESSAELTEAINSMFDWYQRSAICLVYLEDFEYHDVDLEGLERCRYWTRGWTLQELLAPDAVDFFDSSWQPFGTKYTLKEEISDITSISVRYLEISDRVHQASVAERMSWAANRRTTRAEDLAYCLMGIFDVNMPLLYGEGEKAFIRLQEEIIKHNDDRTIFCWSHSQRTHPRFLSWKGCLAPHPITFRQGGDFLARPESSVVGTNSEFQLTNSGLRIGLPLLRGVLGGRALAAIEVLEKDHAGNEKLCVCLEQLSENTFVRVHVPKDLLRVPRGWIEATTNVQVYLVHERNPGRKFSSLTRVSDVSESLCLLNSPSIDGSHTKRSSHHVPGTIESICTGRRQDRRSLQLPDTICHSTNISSVDQYWRWAAPGGMEGCRPKHHGRDDRFGESARPARRHMVYANALQQSREGTVQCPHLRSYPGPSRRGLGNHSTSTRRRVQTIRHATHVVAEVCGICGAKGQSAE